MTCFTSTADEMPAYVKPPRHANDYTILPHSQRKPADLFRANYAILSTVKALSPDQAYQPHLSSVGVCKTDAIAAKIAARTKDDVEVIKSVLAVQTQVIKDLLAQGLRVVIDGLCRVELEPRGKMDAEDSVWDPAKNPIAAIVIPSDEIKGAANGTYEGSLYLQLDGDGSSGGLIPLTLEIKS